MYEKLLSITHPGTEIKVTPDNEAPIIPKATIYQGDLRFPIKKELLSAFFDVRHEMIIKREKYPKITLKSSPADILKIYIGNLKDVR